jgi:hydrogenase maturation protease
MTPGSADRHRPEILVLGLGNQLLRDDGVGLELLRRLESRFGSDPSLEFVDGGTLGIALLPYLERRRAIVILDAVALGAAPGSIHVLDDPSIASAPRGVGAHGGNASELLAVADLLGDLPPRVLVIGIEPAEIRTGLGLSKAVVAALPEACDAAGRALALVVGTAALGP